MIESIIREQYGLHLCHAQRASAGAGSDTWFLRCEEGQYVLKFPAVSPINHPAAEPTLCEFLRAHGIPACDFLKNNMGSYLSRDAAGRLFTVQRRFPGITPAWNRASEALLLESAEMLGKIHRVLRNYPALPEGIGAGFFANMTPQRAAESFRHSLAEAIRLGDGESVAELKWRIDLAERFPVGEFEMNKLTLRNTHGDYFISQFLCEDGHLTAVIDWTTACMHPVIWEVMRSFVYGAPGCDEGRIDERLLDRYLAAYGRYGELNAYDLENRYRLYFYQIAVCDYYGQYYASSAAHRIIYLRQARHATRLLRAMEAFVL